MMDAQWKLVARKEFNGGPDFIVYEGESFFGLEVHEIFKGKTTRNQGSKLKKNQSVTQSHIDNIRRQYEKLEKEIPLYVKFLGPLKGSHSELTVQALQSMQLREKKFPYTDEVVLEQDSDRLKIVVRRLPDGWPRDRLHKPDWFSITDTVGWVENDSQKILNAVKKKSEKIGQYKHNISKELNVGKPEGVDVRLLLVSDHLWSYGQVSADKEVIDVRHGFDVVYFFPFPEMPIKLKSR